MRSLSALLTVLILAAAAAAQTQVPFPFESSAPPPADETVRELLVEFNRLGDSLRNNGGVKERDLEILGVFNDKVEAAMATRADDQHLLAIRIQLGTWMKDDAVIDDGFRRLIAVTEGRQAYIEAWITHHKRSRDDARVAALYEELATTYTENIDLRIAWATTLINQCNFTRAMDMLEQSEIDAAENPRAMLALAECLLAEERFADIAEALDRIPETVIAADGSVKARSELLRRQAAEYVETWTREQELRSAQTRAGDLPRVQFTTADGTFIAELYEDEAPNTVANFVSLAEDGFFDGTKFTTLVPGYSIEGGDPLTRIGGTFSSASGRNPGYRIRDEHGEPDARSHFSGTLTMNSGSAADSGGSLFVICFRPAPERNGKNTAFGRIVEGLDVARKLQQNDALESVTVIRKRDHEYEPETLPLATPTITPSSPTIAPTTPAITPPTSQPTAP